MMTDILGIAGKVFPLVDQVSKNLEVWKTLKGNKKCRKKKEVLKCRRETEIPPLISVARKN